MQLTLDAEEVVLLRRLLEADLSDLREEIYKTENHDWRQSMHADEARLKRILEVLNQAGASQPV